MTRDVYLSTVTGGRVFVMDFARWGMAGAQPRFQIDHRMVALGELAELASCRRPTLCRDAAAPRQPVLRFYECKAGEDEFVVCAENKGVAMGVVMDRCHPTTRVRSEWGSPQRRGSLASSAPAWRRGSSERRPRDRSTSWRRASIQAVTGDRRQAPPLYSCRTARCSRGWPPEPRGAAAESTTSSGSSTTCASTSRRK
jgi:hypothetical protein